jgi:hypothetical protein
VLVADAEKGGSEPVAVEVLVIEPA